MELSLSLFFSVVSVEVFSFDHRRNELNYLDDLAETIIVNCLEDLSVKKFN